MFFRLLAKRFFSLIDAILRSTTRTSQGVFICRKLKSLSSGNLLYQIAGVGFKCCKMVGHHYAMIEYLRVAEFVTVVG